MPKNGDELPLFFFDPPDARLSVWHRDLKALAPHSDDLAINELRDKCFFLEVARAHVNVIDLEGGRADGMRFDEVDIRRKNGLARQRNRR